MLTERGGNPAPSIPRAPLHLAMTPRVTLPRGRWRGADPPTSGGQMVRKGGPSRAAGPEDAAADVHRSSVLLSQNLHVKDESPPRRGPRCCCPLG